MRIAVPLGPTLQLVIVAPLARQTVLVLVGVPEPRYGYPLLDCVRPRELRKR